MEIQTIKEIFEEKRPCISKIRIEDFVVEEKDESNLPPNEMSKESIDKYIKY